MSRLSLVQARIWLPVGLLVFALSASFSILNPLNIAWLDRGDMAAHFMGWHFFRQSDWNMPIGLNPDYGLEMGSSLVFSDSIPLLAIFLKPFNEQLPEYFQYFGLWLLACLLLQAFFAQKLMALLTADWLLQLPGVVLLTVSPIMLQRMSGHLSLTAHFFPLAALYLCLRFGTERRVIWWCLLLCCAASVHAYLLAMVLAIWVADVAGRCLQGEIEAPRALFETVCVAVLLTIVMWQVGYFTIGRGIVVNGYGYYRMNLFAPLDPMDWSQLLRSRIANGDYEGFSFPGLGVWLAVMFAVPALLQQPLSQRRFPAARRNALLVVLIGLLFYAISNKIGFAQYTIELPLPPSIIELANIFRASGRMSWPVVYFCSLGAMWALVRSYPRATAAPLLFVACLVQLLDAGAKLTDLRLLHAVSPSSSWTNELSDPFWSAAAKRYEKLRWLPTQNNSESWKRLAMVAAKHGMATDAVYVSRPHPGTQILKQQTGDLLVSQNWDEDTLYVMSVARGRKLSSKVDTSRHFIIEVDGLFVLAPAWHACEECSGRDLAKFSSSPHS